jgi:hypothetical protein
MALASGAACRPAPGRATWAWHARGCLRLPSLWLQCVPCSWCAAMPPGPEAHCCCVGLTLDPKPPWPEARCCCLGSTLDPQPPGPEAFCCYRSQGLSLKASVEQFSHTMTAQADLRVEAAHLRRFYANFWPVRDSVSLSVHPSFYRSLVGTCPRTAGMICMPAVRCNQPRFSALNTLAAPPPSPARAHKGSSECVAKYVQVTAPCPVPGYESDRVLVETFEQGESVARYINTLSPFNTQVRPADTRSLQRPDAGWPLPPPWGGSYF